MSQPRTLELRRLARYALVGIANTTLSLVVYVIALRLGAPYLLSGIVAYAAGIFNGYTWNRVWTFETGAFHAWEFSRYTLIQGLGLVMNTLLLAVAVEHLGMGHLAAEFATLIPVVLITFGLNQWWTFRVQEHRS